MFELSGSVRQVCAWVTGLPSNLDPDDADRRRAIRQWPGSLG
jgi:hypothetical protein